jgi:hypothetical protein
MQESLFQTLIWIGIHEANIGNSCLFSKLVENDIDQIFGTSQRYACRLSATNGEYHRYVICYISASTAAEHAFPIRIKIETLKNDLFLI